MRLLPTWLREFVNIPVDDTALARDLTQAGINIEGVSSEHGQAIFEAEITTNRPDAMNHYGVARECAAIYNAELQPLSSVVGRRSSADVAESERPKTDDRRPTTPPSAFPIEILDAQGCAR